MNHDSRLEHQRMKEFDSRLLYTNIEMYKAFLHVIQIQPRLGFWNGPSSDFNLLHCRSGIRQDTASRPRRLFRLLRDYMRLGILRDSKAALMK
jgi:hypothetical protein